MMSDKPRVLVNLNETFFTIPSLQPIWEGFREIAELETATVWSTEELRDLIEGKDAVINWGWPPFDEVTLAKAEDLRFVALLNASRSSAQHCLEKGLTLVETRKAWSPSVAEMALTLLLNALRRITPYHMEMKAGTENWVEAFPADIDPLERQLSGRKVGVVGFGGIGQRFAQLVEPFGVTLKAFDPYLPAEVAAQYGATLVDMDTLVDESECLILCAADTKETHKILSAERIARLGKGTVVVLVGRSWLIDVEAALERCRAGDIIWMCDVFDEEPLPADDPIRKVPNFYGTPHRAGGVLQSVERHLQWVLDDYKRFLAGEPLQHQFFVAQLPSLSDR